MTNFDIICFAIFAILLAIILNACIISGGFH